ncbi:hypothetical protein UNSWDHB_2654 [Dehalobacter sp. UNSWDHB]|uniref:hypothetical protein n=1 Tax=Dehalobacter sp. UNSWDHB TaxID=1339256 RepID=UPI000387A4A7|nr:hypothetical protein [Dehalobacter sp. UNSWDHB]EQB20068.1 hypothetical protein UNSWDHB_2654 [Dehalobacter sp. UNSWDHB]
MQKFIQIGTTAARDPKTGEFLKAVPIYKEATQDLTQAETAAFEDVGRLFAGKMKQYIEGGGLVERRGKV